MRILVAGTSHSSAPLSVLERLSVPTGDLESALAWLKSRMSEAFVLSTCNRTELYAVHDGGDSEVLLELLAERTSTRAADLRPFIYVKSQEGAVRHLLRVAGGLESMVLGEDQIQAQMKRALAAARTAGALGPITERLGAAALTCGKRIRTFTGIGHHSVSLESLAVEAACDSMQSLSEGNVLVLGSGSSASVIVQQLRSRGISGVFVLGRSRGNVNTLAHTHNVSCADWELLPVLLREAAVVFCCTSAPHPVVTTETLALRVAQSQRRPLLCLDLGMPRDVDESIAKLPGVSVIDLDKLGTLASAHKEARKQHVPAAEAIVERETARFFDWVGGRSDARAKANLYAQAQAVADAEVKRSLARLPRLSANDRAIISELARRIARKLAHRSIQDHEVFGDPNESAVPAEEAS